MQPESSSELRSCWPPTPGCRTRPLPRASVWAARPSTGPSATSWRALSGRPCIEEPRPGAKRKLTGQEEALLVATACSRPPEGRARWTIELLAGEMVRLTEHDHRACTTGDCILDRIYFTCMKGLGGCGHLSIL